jgi:hypothetical protein
MGTGNTSEIMTWFGQGGKDYFLGNHPLWEIFRTGYQMSKKPLILGGTLLIAGYAWRGITTKKRPIPDELVEFIRKEQINRLKALIKRKSI